MLCALKEEDHTCDICPEMDLMTRAQGYFASAALGMLFNALVQPQLLCAACTELGLVVQAMISLWSGDGTTFGLLYTLGELCLLFGSFFLSQPGAQCKAMWSDWETGLSSFAWLFSLGLIILVTFTLGDSPGGVVLLVLLVIIEKIAYFWYTLAFFPGGHYAAKTMLSTICGSMCGGG